MTIWLIMKVPLQFLRLKVQLPRRGDGGDGGIFS
jgi:hypothetical protein